MLKKLDLPSLQSRRKQMRLTMLYKVVEGLVPALPAEKFVTPVPKGKRKVRAKTFSDCVAKNPIEKFQILNDRGLKISNTGTKEQYKHSFFVRTVQEWNALDSITVNAPSVGAFSSAAGRSFKP